MNAALIHLLLVVAGAAIGLAALWFFARVTGGIFSMAGLFFAAFLALSVCLVLAGFGAMAFPGLEAGAP